MKRLVTVLAAGLMLASCGNVNRGVANMTGFSRSCVAGISYLQFPSGVTPEIDPNTDKPRHCS